ncbi:MAG: OadG family protein [Ruminococcus sp.]|jgi:sodium pump decarboxylase gamma subunit|nr:OadG family protein [Ruminococcus sp.]
MGEMLMSWGDVWTVVLTGISIVFVALVILIAIVWAYGKIFQTIEKKKTDRVTPDNGISVPLTESVTSKSTGTADGVSSEVVAAITAAVYAFTDGRGVVTGIKVQKRIQNGRRRSTEWGYAGTVSAMKKLNRIGR